MYIYALTYRNPHEDRPFVMFVAAPRLLTLEEAVNAAIDTANDDQLGNEWIEAISQGTLCGPLEVDGTVRQPSIAVTVE